MRKFLPFFFIFVFTLFFYLPILLKPSILTDRGNDLTQFFFPIFYFVKESLINHNQLPLWNNLFFSGTPLLPDPQAPIFYLPNILFLLTKSIDSGFLISIFVHIFIAGIGMYLLAKSLKFSPSSSVLCALLYIASPKLSGYIEAGHFGLITSWAWLPFAFLSTTLLARRPTIKRATILAIFLALIFYGHILIFCITVIAVTVWYLYLSLRNKHKLIKIIKWLMFSGCICFGLIAVSFLPQLFWQNQTTRNLLLNNPDVYPKWIGLKDFLKASISPILFGYNFIWSLDTEKTITLGLLTSVFAFIGFLKLKRIQKSLILFISTGILLISLNNISPLYNLLVKQNWYVLIRVSTRFWFLLVIIFILLAGFGFNYLIKTNKYKFLIFVLATLSVTELFLTSWSKIIEPIKPDINLAPIEIYKFISQDKTKFRVFCLERCLSQKEAVLYGLELADGYGTLQQLNYYLESEQLSQSFYRNRYTLSIPPFEIFEYENLQPYSPNLAALNVKYIISNHILTDKNLKLIKIIGNYLIYINEINLPRSNYPIEIYSPNFIKIDTSSQKDNTLTLSEVYNKDWKAYLNGSTETKITETPDKTREVKIQKDTKFVDFVYLPNIFLVGLVITFVTIVIIILFLIR